MAEITWKPNDSRHRVQLDDSDRLAIKEALKRKQQSGCTATEIATALGVGRTYLYALADYNFIELSRFAQMQAYLGLKLLNESQVDTYLQSIRDQLLPDLSMRLARLELAHPKARVPETRASTNSATGA